MIKCVFVLDVELDALGEDDLARVVQARGRSAHVLLPRVRAGLAAPASRLVAAERAANLGAIGGRIQINDARVGTARSLELGPGLGIVGED